MNEPSAMHSTVLQNTSTSSLTFSEQTYRISTLPSIFFIFHSFSSQRNSVDHCHSRFTRIWKQVMIQVNIIMNNNKLTVAIKANANSEETTSTAQWNYTVSASQAKKLVQEEKLTIKAKVYKVKRQTSTFQQIKDHICTNLTPFVARK